MVREPEVQIAGLRILPRIGDDLVRERFDRARVGVAQVGVDPGAREEPPLPVEFGDELPPVGTHLAFAVGFVPRAARDAEHPRDPAVADPMMEQPAPGSFRVEVRDEGVDRRVRDGSRQQRGVVLVAVPAPERERRAEELRVVGVEAQFGREIDRFHDVGVAHGALEADPPAAVGRAFAQCYFERQSVALRDELARPPRPHEGAPRLAEEAVDPDQHAPRVAARDEPRAVPDVDVDRIVQLAVGNVRHVAQTLGDADPQRARRGRKGGDGDFGRTRRIHPRDQPRELLRREPARFRTVGDADVPVAFHARRRVRR